MIRHDAKGLPLERDVRMTENTAAMPVGEGVLWRGKVEPTAFKLHVADPVSGQVGLQTVLNVEGRPALVAIRLRVERLSDGQQQDAGTRVTESEHEVEVFPFVTLPYGSGNGWTMGAGR